MSNLTRTGRYLFWNRRIGEAREARQVPRTGQTTVYRTGDDGDLEVGNPATVAVRFQTFTAVAGEPVVFDRLTGLYWPADYSGDIGSPFDAKVLWNAAIDQCLALDFGGFDDWRLPNNEELLSIMDFENGGAYSPITVQSDGNGHWTSTTYQLSTTIAYTWLHLGPLQQQKTKAVDSQWVIPVRGAV